MALDLANNTATNTAREVLTKKYGPLPLWAWLIIITGTVYGVRKFMGARADDNADEAVDSGTVSPNSLTGGRTGLVTPRTDQAGVYGGGSLTGASGASVTVGEPLTNQQWLSRAVTLMTSQGTGWDGFRIQTALQRFVNGLSITDPTDRAIISQALSTPAIGAPPSNPQGDAGTGWNTDNDGGYLPDLQIVRLIAGRVNTDYGQPEYRPDGGLTDRANGGIYAQYTDGSIRWVSNPQELINIFRTDPGLETRGVENLAINDPVWSRATDGPDSKFR